MPRHDDEERGTRGRPTGALLLRFAYGAGLIALGACLGIVIGSLTETPRLLLERLRGPVETVELGTPAPAKAAGSAASAPLERFGELQEGKRPKPSGEPAEAKPEPELEPPPERVPPAELEPAPPVAAAPVAEPPPVPAGDPAEPPAAPRPQSAVVQVASFVERKPAEELVAKLGGSGFDAYVSQPAAQNGRFRVRVRPGTGESSEDLAKRLRGVGFDTWATSE
ncbi:MAG: SPOR domain-containing protein [Deltaproteobacteria bacterium]|nr:SPOR domain-containing protein [Deltaproteobacteria bacterium]